MNTGTMTLTEFLLARIAEDEERATFVLNQMDDWAKNNQWEIWRLSWHDEYDLLCIEPQRALAECEAKRRIVEWAAPVLTNWPNAPEGFRYVSDDGLELLKILALPYADHPDYREEWRVA